MTRTTYFLLATMLLTAVSARASFRQQQSNTQSTVLVADGTLPPPDPLPIPTPCAV